MRKLLAATALYFALTASAGAVAFPGQAEMTRPHPDVVKSLAVAKQFWADRGLTTQCSVTFFVVDDLGVADDNSRSAVARANRSTCSIYLLRSNLVRELSNQVAEFPDDEFSRKWSRRTNRRLLCLTIVHEYGHLLGLQHTDSGVMAIAQEKEAIPYDCKRAFPAPRLSRYLT